MSGLPVILVHAAKLASRYEARGHSWPGSFRQVDSCDSPERDHGAACDRAGQALLAARPCDTARSMGEGPRARRRGEWMDYRWGTWDPMTQSKFGFMLRTRSSSWTSRLSDALGEQSGDHANVPIFGCGCCGIAAKAVRFSLKRWPTTQLTRPSTFYVILR
jgi:hypothetical protein